MLNEEASQPSEVWRETVILIRPRPLLSPTTIEITATQDTECNEPSHLELGAGLPWAAFEIRGLHVPASTDEVFELLRTWCDEVACVEYNPVKGAGTVSFVDCLPVTVGEVLELGGSPLTGAGGAHELLEMPGELAIEESGHDPS